MQKPNLKTNKTNLYFFLSLIILCIILCLIWLIKQFPLLVMSSLPCGQSCDLQNVKVMALHTAQFENQFFCSSRVGI